MIQVRIVDDFAFGGGVAVYIVEGAASETAWGETIVRPQGRRLMRMDSDGSWILEPFEDPAAGPVTPTFRLPDEGPRALMEALARYYHGDGDTRALRRDYDAERGRVDKLTDALIGIAGRARVDP